MPLSKANDAIRVLALGTSPETRQAFGQILDCPGIEAEISSLDPPEDPALPDAGGFDAIILGLPPERARDLDPISRIAGANPATPLVVMIDAESLPERYEILDLGAAEIISPGDLTPAGLRVLLNSIVERSKLSGDLEGARLDLARERRTAASYFDLSPIINLELDTDGNILRLNSKGARILECDQDEARGKSWFESFVPETGRVPVKETFRWLMDEKIGPDEAIEHPIRTAGGKELWIRWQNSLVRDADGNTTGVFCSGEDVTEQRAAREELRRSEEKYRQVVENAGQAILVAQDGVAKFVNPKAMKILGAGENRIIGKPFVNLIAEEDREMVMQRHKDRMLGKEPPSEYSFRILRPDGEKIWVEINAVLINWNGAPATLNFLTDINDRIVAEQEKSDLQAQLLLSQKLEAVGRLAGGVAHDFNNLLSVINSAAVFLLEEFQEESQTRADIMDIKEAADKGAALTRQLLALSRRQVMEPRIIDPAKTISDMRRMLGRIIGEDIELIVTDDGRAGMIKVDPGQLEQILINLTVNSRDAMPSGGKLVIDISTRKISAADAKRIGNLEPGPHIAISITDTGVGIPEDVLPRVFEPFYTTKSKGSGLGLATVYGIVSQSGGGIWVTSEPGSGARFEIFLPRQNETDEEIRSRLPVPAALWGTETILVVEDDKMVRHVASRSLERSGYKVLEASNAGEALLMCDSHEGPIHLVLSDVVMPFMVGPDMVPRLQQLRPEMKVVYMSGYMERDIVKRLEDQDVPFIGKPFAPEKLVLMIRSVLDSQG